MVSFVQNMILPHNINIYNAYMSIELVVTWCCNAPMYYILNQLIGPTTFAYLIHTHTRKRVCSKGQFGLLLK